MIAELTRARGRQLTQQLNSSATLTFTLDGRGQQAALVQELAQDVIAWRWDEASGADVPYFRGLIGQSEDQITEQSHTVTFTAHDYIAALGRRIVGATLNYNNADQDYIASAGAPLSGQSASLLTAAKYAQSTNGATSFSPGAYLPLVGSPVNPDGTARVQPSGQQRVRAYPGSTNIGTALDDLAHVINGFDYDVLPALNPRATSAVGDDMLRIFYPSQGVTRANPVLEYGGKIATVTRAVNSADYANFIRTLGNNGSTDPAAAQLYSERWNADANNVTVTPVGLWQDDDNAADVNVQATLDQQAAGKLNLLGVLVPTYTLGLRAGTYSEGAFYMGDVVPVVIRSGRLNVTTQLRIVGLVFDMPEDSDEDVSVTVGRPIHDLANMLNATAKDVNALVRR